jgi:NADH pyrophosphatase NudC (nudix superfamily)
MHTEGGAMIDKPSDKEQEYFIKKELEKIKAMREEHFLKQKEAERAKLKELHHMHCPKCGQTMSTVTLTGVEVDVCPGCGGMYLDQGELAQLVDASHHSRLAGALASARRMWHELAG